MEEIKGEIWDFANKNTVVCILTNNSIINGSNPMGGGIAREALDRNPGIDVDVAYAIRVGMDFIGFDTKTSSMLYRFPTKKTVNQKSDLATIKNSLVRLKDYANMVKWNTILLPRPGCGFGGLDWESQVRPLVKNILSDCKNVLIFSKE